jgi:SOS-response transcriptional repressor LexA
MTPRQNDVYIVIEAFWEKFGFSPSIDEVMKLARMKSRGSASRIINELILQGAVKRIPGKRRTVRPAYIKFKKALYE